jgi:spore coat polysaccharide biosynthesis protein SpsF
MKIGAIIPVRLTAERLPGKALMEVGGRPILYYLLDRVRACRYIDDVSDIVICTTRESGDDPLVEAVQKYGASVFRGDKDDIIRRFRDAVHHFGFDAVVQVDGDDPLSATEYMNLTMERLLETPGLGIAWSEDLPIGLNSKSFTRAALDTVFEAYSKGRNDTGFIYFFTKTDLVAKSVVALVDPKHRCDRARLTLDYPEDFKVFRCILEAVDKDGHTATLSEVMFFLEKRSDVMDINAKLDEQYWQRTRDLARLTYRDPAGNSVEIAI